MRTLLLLSVLCVLALWSLRNPFVAAMTYAWIGLMNPHRLTWGIATTLPLAMIFALLLFASILINKEKLDWRNAKAYWPVYLYWAWTTITTITAAAPEAAGLRYSEFFKTQVIVVTTLLLLTSEQRIRIFVAVVSLSVCFYGAKGGAFALMTGGSHRVWGPENSMIMDNNHIAVALLVMLPFTFWLAGEAKRRAVRLSLVAVGTLSIVAAVFTYSRSALVGGSAMALLACLYSKNRVRNVLFLAVAGAAIWNFAPDKLFDRAETIAEYEQDASVEGRFQSWTVAFRVASAHLLGGGYDYYENKDFWRSFGDPDWVPRASHSIYFQALGEQGWIGMFMFLTILGVTTVRVLALRRHAIRVSKSPSARLLAESLLLSIVGFAVGGAFLNLGYWDGYFYIVGLVAALSVRMRSFEVVQRTLNQEHTPLGPNAPAASPKHAWR